jgi:hypothetical protein
MPVFFVVVFMVVCLSVLVRWFSERVRVKRVRVPGTMLRDLTRISRGYCRRVQCDSIANVVGRPIFSSSSRAIASSSNDRMCVGELNLNR